MRCTCIYIDTWKPVIVINSMLYSSDTTVDKWHIFVHRKLLKIHPFNKYNIAGYLRQYRVCRCLGSLRYQTTKVLTTVYLKKYAHGFVVLCFVVVMQSFIMNSHEVFIHIHQGCFAGTGVIVRLPQCQWSEPDGYGKISQCITTTKHSKAKTVCIFLGIYCMWTIGACFFIRKAF